MVGKLFYHPDTKQEVVMAAKYKRQKTQYPGVFYHVMPRTGHKEDEKVYYIRFKRDGKQYEERVGGQHSNDMTPQRANNIRAERIEGKRESRLERQKRETEAREAEHNAWTVAKIWEYYKEIRGEWNKSLATDGYRYESYIASSFGKEQPKAIKPVDVDRWRMDLEKRNLSPQTVRHIMALLKRILNFAKNRVLCETPDFAFDMPQVDNIKDDALDAEQIDTLAKVLDEEEKRGGPYKRFAGMMRLALFTGMRRGEITNLKWEDIDWRNNLIAIRNPKGGKDQFIPLTNLSIPVLKAQKLTKSSYVFPGKDGQRLKNTSKLSRAIFDKAKLPKDYRPFHSLRHTFATVLASSGKVDMYSLQRLLTHKSPIMTQRYAKLHDEALRRSADVATSIFGGHITGEKEI